MLSRKAISLSSCWEKFISNAPMFDEAYAILLEECCSAAASAVRGWISSVVRETEITPSAEWEWSASSMERSTSITRGVMIIGLEEEEDALWWVC